MCSSDLVRTPVGPRGGPVGREQALYVSTGGPVGPRVKGARRRGEAAPRRPAGPATPAFRANPAPPQVTKTKAWGEENKNWKLFTTHFFDCQARGQGNVEEEGWRAGGQLRTGSRADRPPATYRIDVASPAVLEAVPHLRHRCGLDGTTVYRHDWQIGRAHV